jgi:hypothetical protein
VSARPPSWRPTAWQERFIHSLERSIWLKGPEDCGKQRCLIEVAAVGHEDPLWRAVIICVGQHDKAAMVRATEPIYKRLSAEYAAEFGSEWRFQTSGAVVRIADGVHEARASTGYDVVCLNHIEEFRDSEISEARRLLRRVQGRRPRLRATFRSGREWERHFGAGILFEDGDEQDLDAEPTQELTDLERLVVAITIHRASTASGAATGTWERVLDTARSIPAAPRDAATDTLIKAVDAKDADDKRLSAALDRARHHLAELQGAEAGACHTTCSSACSLRTAPRDVSADVPLR